MIQPYLRRALRTIGQNIPALKQFGGKLGLGRLLSQGSNTIERVTIDGDVIIELDLGVTQFRHYYFLDNQTTAPENTIARRVLTRGDTYVDVGAHLGYYSLVAAKYAGKVIGFEPSPVTFKHLQRNLELNPILAKRYVAHQLGLADKPGEATINFSDEIPGASSLRQVDFTHTRSVPVKLETLDHMMRDEHPTFIKIDVEGAELDVFRGGANTIERCRPIVMSELYEPWQKRSNQSCLDIKQFFASRDYECHLVDERHPARHGFVLNAATEERLLGPDINNGLFIPRERVASVMKALDAA